MAEMKEFIALLEADREIAIQHAGSRFIPPRLPQYGELSLDSRLRSVFGVEGIGRFYTHQVETIERVRQGGHALLMTPTASGKSLAYNVPVLETILDEPTSRALYLFPLKGLEQDQFRYLDRVGRSLGIANVAAVYDGDTPAHLRRKIREDMPNVVFTNPDMLHLAFLPFHRKWEDFFRNLRYVVVDEIHAYRGVFGTHVSQIFRRLRRICDHYGASPQFIAASATIANPGRLAEDLTGLPFHVVDRSGAPQAGKHFMFLNPVESPYTLATRLFVRCLGSEVRTIVFTRARKITELIFSWATGAAPELADKISPYRAGFLPKERREIERRLFSGELLGVVSTSALELGVDIGGLDCCILCGYPGSVASTWQRAGRVGRQGQDSLVVLIGIQDALDQYFMRHPEAFFAKSHEAAVVDPGNETVLRRHLECAGAELPLKPGDEACTGLPLSEVIPQLEQDGILRQAKKGGVWYSRNRSPHRSVSIRATGERFSLVDESGRPIGELTGGRVFREAFPGAVYLHRGRQYLVTHLDVPARRAVCREARLPYYTHALSSETTEVIEERQARMIGMALFYWGILRITQRVVGYDRKRASDSVRLGTHGLELPEHVFETEGLWTVISRETEAEIVNRRFDLGGTLHAVEHTAIASMPLFALCDRGDVGGLSHTGFPAFGLPAIFIYDGHEGGVGLAKRAFEIGEEWLAATLRIIEDCPCSDGCPSCVQDSQCGNRNEPLDKQGSRYLLRQWLGLT